MTTPTINLLPRARRIAAIKRAAIARWSTATLVLAGVMLAPASALAIATTGGSGIDAEHARRAQKSLQRIDAERPGLERELQGLKRTEQVLRRIDDRIDWRPVLGGLSDACGPARFERIEAKLDRDKKRIEIRIVGLVETLPEARELALRLERTGIFRDVVLSGTNQVGYTNREVTRFEMTTAVALGGAS